MAFQILSFQLKQSPEAKQHRCAQLFWPECFHLNSVFSAQLWSQNRKNKTQTKNKPFAQQTKAPGNAILKNNKNKNKKGGRERNRIFFLNHCLKASSSKGQNFRSSHWAAQPWLALVRRAKVSAQLSCPAWHQSHLFSFASPPTFSDHYLSCELSEAHSMFCWPQLEFLDTA